MKNTEKSAITKKDIENSRHRIMHKVSVGITSETLVELSKQMISFPQAILELVDNAVAAAKRCGQALIYIWLMACPDDDEKIKIAVVDFGVGMDLDGLKNALQLGSVHIFNSSLGKKAVLNEHGFGMKNAIAALTEGKNDWSIFTRTSPSGPYYTVANPYGPEMKIIERSESDVLAAFKESFSAAPSTIVTMDVNKKFADTLDTVKNAKRAKKESNRRHCSVDELKLRLIEHLGVTYGHMFTFNQDLQDNEVKIVVKDAKINDRVIDCCVPAIPVPYESMAYSKKFTVSMKNHVKANCQFSCGRINHTLRDECLFGGPLKNYYMGTRDTEGITVVYNGRVIAPSMYTELYGLDRHNNFNGFIGELIVDCPSHGALSTLNNKTGVNLQDEDWDAIFNEIRSDNRCQPIAAPGKMCVSELTNNWLEKLKATARDGDEITTQSKVWPVGARIDILLKSSDCKYVALYDIKAVKASIQHILQVRGYWDGLVLSGIQPTCAKMIVKGASESTRAVLAQINKLPTPMMPDGTQSAPYNIEFILG